MHDHAGHVHDGHGHSGAHGHLDGGAAGRPQRRLAWTLALAALYLGAEVVGGILTGSLALLADAGHMLSDVAALGLSLFAVRVAGRPPTSRHTYGFHRVEILAALANAATLLAIVGLILIEAWERFQDPPPVVGGGLLAVAAGGLAVNLAGLAILHGGRRDSLNVRGAWLHVLTDALGSVAAIVAGALIVAFDWRWVDPLASVLIGLLIGWSAWSLLRETLAILMEQAPGHIDVDDVRRSLAGSPGVAGVHDLHVWTLTGRQVALSCHVVEEAGGAPDLLELHRTVYDRFGIEHVTIQVEPAGFKERECCF